MVINGLDIQSVNNDRENNGQIENYSSQDDKCLTLSNLTISITREKPN